MKKLTLLIFTLFIFVPVKSDILVKPIFEGNKKAKIKIIVYESLTCGHCADFHKNVYPQLKENYIDTGLAYIEFKSFPLDLAALNASKLAHCKNDGKSQILHLLYKEQNNWIKGNTIEELNLNLKNIINDQNLGLDFDKCINNKNIEDYVLEDRVEGIKKYKVNATPTIIINEEKFEKPLTFKNLKKFLEKLV